MVKPRLPSRTLAANLQARPMPKRTSGPSGQHRTPRRFLGMSPEEWELVDEATEEGQTWTSWARDVVAAEARRRIARAKTPAKPRTPTKST